MVNLKGALYRKLKGWQEERKLWKEKERVEFEKAYRKYKEEAIRKRAIEKAKAKAFAPPLTERFGIAMKKVIAPRPAKVSKAKISKPKAKKRKLPQEMDWGIDADAIFGKGNFGIEDPLKPRRKKSLW